jgi:hypothetical protein
MSMSIHDYTPNDYDSVTRLWIDCGLIQAAKQATEEELNEFCKKGTFLTFKEESDGIIGTVMGTWDGGEAGSTNLLSQKNIGTKV